MGDRDYFRKDYLGKKSIFQPGPENAIASLVIVNLVVFTLLFFTWVIYTIVVEADFTAAITSHLNVPASPSSFIIQPWTVLTYMFVHSGFWNLFSNMLWLWAFGQIFQLIAGSDKVVPVYLYSGFFAAVFFVLVSGMTHQSMVPVLTGAGAATMGIAIAATALSPDYRLFPMLGNGIPLWVLTGLFVLIDFLNVRFSANLAAAHVAAGVTGFIYVTLLKGGRDTGAWMHRFAAWLGDLFNPNKKYTQGKAPVLYYKAKKEPFVKKPNLTQQKLDEILDKINQKGYDSLSEEEKEFLKKASEHL